MGIHWDKTRYAVTFPDTPDIHSLNIVPLPYTREPPYLEGDDYPLPRALLTINFASEGAAKLYQDFYKDKTGIAPWMHGKAIDIPLYHLEAAYIALGLACDNFNIFMDDGQITHILAWTKRHTDTQFREILTKAEREEQYEFDRRIGDILKAGVDDLYPSDELHDAPSVSSRKIADSNDFRLPATIRNSVDRMARFSFSAGMSRSAD